MSHKTSFQIFVFLFERFLPFSIVEASALASLILRQRSVLVLKLSVDVSTTSAGSKNK